jgi:branched-chain amino acid transport system ATP-binding protein
MLEVQNIFVNYGAAPALWDVSIQVRDKELVCVVGPNGAGKTTLINAIAGLHAVKSGQLVLKGRDVTRLQGHSFCEAGIAIVPEGRRLFTQMTVLENLELGGFTRSAKARRAALMAGPSLLLLDEPSLGLAPSIVMDMFDAIRKINQEGTAVLLVEQNVSMALETANRAYVMEEGRVIAQGEAREMMGRPEIQKAYLGIEN